MKYHVLTLFPEMIRSAMSSSLMGKAIENERITLNAVNIRDYTEDRHHRVDDYPYGGGAGMLMQAQPVYDAHRAVTQGRRVRTVYLTPQGYPFTQKMAREMAEEEELVFLCGHYEGIDQRVLDEIVTDYVSIGDYILTGGELAALVMMDAISRFVPGVLGNHVSAMEESFYNDLLEYPQYTRPESWHEMYVPEVLLSGNQKMITGWRLEQAEQKTEQIRPDLYQKYLEKQNLMKQLQKDKKSNIHMIESLRRGLGEILYQDKDGFMILDSRAAIVMLQGKEEQLLEKLVAMIPEGIDYIAVNQQEAADYLDRHGFDLWGKCTQYVYTQNVPLSVKYKDIRLLTMEDFDIVSRTYHDVTARQIQRKIDACELFGAYVEDELAGYIGFHDEGSSGMLYVLPQYRGMGLAESLEAYLINQCLIRGYVPFGQVVDGNVPSHSLQKKLGLFPAKNPMWWFETKEKCKDLK